MSDVLCRRPVGACRGSVLLVAAAALLLPACGKNRQFEQAPTPPPTATYSGPSYLRGTVGSLARIRNNRSVPVSGYGLVVGLDGTGHRGAPAYLRQFLINEMRKQGVGQVSTRDILPLTPAQLLDSTNTAVVKVEGLIPAGSTKGTKFDLMVTALPSTQTTSLAGGTLYTTDLAVGGADRSTRFLNPLARGRGQMYINPFGAHVEAQDIDGLRREAMVVAGGSVTEDQQIELVLNQPSWQRSRIIADRINERFPMAADDRAHHTANAVNNVIIEIEIPKRYKAHPEKLMKLIGHFYINNTTGFEAAQAERLYEELRDDPEQREAVTLAWKALGRVATPKLREYYGINDRLDIKLASLEAGAYLQDERASQHLLELAGHDDPAVRKTVAQTLVHLPRSVRGGRALKQLLDDRDTEVRVAAYESLATNGDPLVDRMAVSNEAGLKFIIDRVPAQRPLVYITYHRVPRVVIFDDQLGFKTEHVARLWNNRLMLRQPDTLAQALFGLEAGGTVFVPIRGRTDLVEVGSPRWQTTITDEVGDTAELIIESKTLANTLQEKVTKPGDAAQAMIVAQLIERRLNEATRQVETRLKLLDLRDADSVRPITVYYKAPDQVTGQTYKITPTVATFAYLLASDKAADSMQDGLDLSYSQVVDALYHLCKAGHIDAPIRVDTTPLAALLDRRDDNRPGPRPESTGRPEATPRDDAATPPAVPGRPETAPEEPGIEQLPEGNAKSAKR